MAAISDWHREPFGGVAVWVDDLLQDERAVILVLWWHVDQAEASFVSVVLEDVDTPNRGIRVSFDCVLVLLRIQKTARKGRQFYSDIVAAGRALRGTNPQYDAPSLRRVRHCGNVFRQFPGASKPDPAFLVLQRIWLRLEVQRLRLREFEQFLLAALTEEIPDLGGIG